MLPLILLAGAAFFFLSQGDSGSGSKPVPKPKTGSGSVAGCSDLWTYLGDASFARLSSGQPVNAKVYCRMSDKSLVKLGTASLVLIPGTVNGSFGAAAVVGVLTTEPNQTISLGWTVAFKLVEDAQNQSV